ncbi:rRNA-processing protein EFG1 [Kalmanozyma brasiliensis GHG001]|uniref:rRNA-processing protein EFG1 n=1 Tax=Kalmanozyma brasiliensis (strain GHG001) TaxID=1365824 RepID=V5ETI4_KALBG|nr:rRNA-processing protein EFG1 [Kalmanozyma brasiliensis GHG001]EST06373.1 rRNA-processing protein EFG1 [Kalmanozyma brasiliensis GHG001]
MPKDTKGKAAILGAEASDSPKRTNTKPYQKRSAPSTSNGASSSKPKSQAPNKKQLFEKSASSGPSSGLPGASKIKSSIRQTKRLLAKPNLAPGTKIEAERRLKSLEADLEVASHKQVEKSRATRYHRIKFVERQKLVRRIARCKRNLARLESGKAAQESDSEGEGSDDDEGYKSQRVKESKMSKGELEKLLKSLRELLQYVVQYPAELRYVALFPNADEGPVVPDAKEKDKSRQSAYQHLQRVRKAMKGGEISNEPEVELNSKDLSLKKLANGSTTKPAETGGTQKTDKKSGKGGKNKRKHEEDDERVDSDEELTQAGGVKGDDFFAQDSDDEE